ncbi:MAG: hypothetical protein BWZ02_00682 [Lentisphaerae bacterium ADurb.BinA184]|nr:MAG: hypothetical protein BWZ02_00682 [Lentisphaerae bacterium ADurb.BinA184]
MPTASTALAAATDRQVSVREFRLWNPWAILRLSAGRLGWAGCGAVAAGLRLHGECLYAQGQLELFVNTEATETTEVYLMGCSILRASERAVGLHAAQPHVGW